MPTNLIEAWASRWEMRCDGPETKLGEIAATKLLRLLLLHRQSSPGTFFSRTPPECSGDWVLDAGRNLVRDLRGGVP